MSKMQTQITEKPPVESESSLPSFASQSSYSEMEMKLQGVHISEPTGNL